jgi:hypothetical protein
MATQGDDENMNIDEDMNIHQTIRTSEVIIKYRNIHLINLTV